MTDLGPEPRPRAALETMPSYLPGRPAPAQPERDVFKVSSNENPYPPLASVRAAIDRAAGEINRYPDMASTELTAAIADTLGVEPAHVVTGTGSVGVLGYLVSAMCDAGDEVVYAWRSFEAYPIICAVAGATAVPVPLATGGRHDLPAMAAAVTPRTRVVIVCTPNNPTGAAVRTEELERFLAEVPADVLVAIDEAYVEFNRDPAAPDVLELWRRHANVVVLRTFSKAYGLAGLRVGYALAHPQVAAALRKTAVPFGVSSLAQAAAVASLAVADELFERVEALVSERRRVESALAASGWSQPASEANFVWFPLGRRSAEFRAACEEAGLVVRQYGDDGVRVTIAEPVANDRLVHVAADWLASRS